AGSGPRPAEESPRSSCSRGESSAAPQGADNAVTLRGELFRCRRSPRRSFPLSRARAMQFLRRPVSRVDRLELRRIAHEARKTIDGCDCVSTESEFRCQRRLAGEAARSDNRLRGGANPPPDKYGVASPSGTANSRIPAREQDRWCVVAPYRADVERAD